MDWKKEREEREAKELLFLEKIQEFFLYLTGENIHESCFSPKLNPDDAFAIIWFLQEVTGIIPDNLEKCDVCHKIYDSDSQGSFFEEESSIIEYYSSLDKNECFLNKEEIKQISGKFFCGEGCENVFIENMSDNKRREL